MSQQQQEDPRIKGNLVMDTVACLVAFVIFFLINRPHVPSNDPAMINFWGAMTAICMTGVFWFAWQMFKVVLRGQRDARNNRR